MSLYACTRLLNCAFMNSFKYLKMRGPDPGSCSHGNDRFVETTKSPNSDAKHVVVSFSHTRNLAKRKNAQDTQQGTNEKVTLLHHVSVCQRKSGSERLSIFIHRLVYTSSQILNQDWGSPLQKWCLLSVQDHKVPLLKCKASEGLFTCTGMIDIPAKTHACSHFIHADGHSPFTVNERPLLFWHCTHF